MSRIRVALIGRPTVLTEALEIVLAIEGYHVRHHHDPNYVPRAAVALVDLDQVSVRRLRAVVARGIPVAALATWPTDAQKGWALLDGARIVLDKQAALRDVVSVVRRLARGAPVLDHAEWQRLVDAVSPGGVRRSGLVSLTRAEREVFDLLADGYTSTEIAAKRKVSEHTVRSQIRAILAKVGVTRQHAAVGIYLRAQMGAAA